MYNDLLSDIERDVDSNWFRNKEVIDNSIYDDFLLF